MNRWLAAGIILIVIPIASIYFLIPSRLIVTKIVLLNCNRDAADRVLGDSSGWEKWWPHGGPGGPNRDGLSYHGVGYRLSGRLQHGAVIKIDDGDKEISSVLNIFPMTPIDSSYLQWQFTRDASWNPLKRVGQYSEAKRLKGDMTVILDSLQGYLGDPKNIYGVAIAEASTNDSFLVETRRTVKGYPGTGVIYDLVKTLDLFAVRRGGVRTGYPMVNIDPLSNGQFGLRTAIPVDKECKDSGDIVFRKLVRGNYLQTDVRGGPAAINGALDRVRNYIADYRRTVMAIPFFSLITDRTQETDSAKWVTRIYYPIY
jgi:hypothetical protein